MALTTCPECDGKLSTTAHSCPHCGYLPPSARPEQQPAQQQQPQQPQQLYQQQQLLLQQQQLNAQRAQQAWHASQTKFQSQGDIVRSTGTLFIGGGCLIFILLALLGAVMKDCGGGVVKKGEDGQLVPADD